MISWELFGLLAAAITTSGFLPQIVKGYRTKSLKDISYWLNGLIGLGMFMWLVYGIGIGSIAVVVANIIGVFLNVTLILMKYRYLNMDVRSG